jgi:hypothetical protein
MAKSRQINTQFWRDGYIANLDPSEKLLFLYFLTNPDTNISGVYQIPLKIIAADTGYDKEMIVKIIERFTKDGKIKYVDGWVIIINFIKHQNQKSPLVKIGIEKEMESIPSHIKEIIKGIDTVSHLILSNPIESNQTESKESSAKPKDEEAVKTTQFLYDSIKRNSDPPTWGSNPPDLDTWYKPIELLHRKDGIAYCDICTVIKWCTQHSFWKSNILSGKSLRDKYNRLASQMKQISNKDKPIYDEEARTKELEARYGNK